MRSSALARMLMSLSQSPVRQNLLASLTSAGWLALLRLAIIPVYLRILGVEAYGLIGFYAALQATLQVLDLGLSPTMSRQMARYSALANSASTTRDFVRTIEVGYWGLGAILGGVICATAPWIATRWFGTTTLPQPVLREVLVLMGVMTALEWPLTIYQSGLVGLQRQVALSAANSVMAAVSAGGAIGVLLLVDPSITMLFRWLALASALHTLLLMLLLWRSLPPAPHRPRFNPHLLHDVWRFAAGVSGIMLTATILSQLDKVLLSRLVSLEQLGYYTVASVAATSIGAIVAPVFNAFSPRFAALVAQGEDVELRRLYHLATQLLTALLAPIASILIFFAPDVLLVWTRNAQVAHAAAPLLRFLVVGTALSGLMFIPYAVQLAYGWTRLYVSVHVALIIVVVPVILVMTPKYGAVVPAVAWASVNAVWMLVGLPVTHRRWLPGAGGAWLTGDILPPLAATLLTAAIAWWLTGFRDSGRASALILGLAGAAALTAALVGARCTRSWALWRTRHSSALRRFPSGVP